MNLKSEIEKLEEELKQLKREKENLILENENEKEKEKSKKINIFMDIKTKI